MLLQENDNKQADDGFCRLDDAVKSFVKKQKQDKGYR